MRISVCYVCIRALCFAMYEMYVCKLRTHVTHVGLLCRYVFMLSMYVCVHDVSVCCVCKV